MKRVKVLANKKHEFEKKMTRLKFNFTEVGRRTEEITVPVDRMDNGFVCTYKNIVISVVDYDVEHQYEANRNHYAVIGVSMLDKVTGVVLTHSFDDTTPVDERYLGVVKCESCNKNHVKNSALILRNRETLSTIMVGKGCLEKYIPDSVASEYINFENFVADEGNSGVVYDGRLLHSHGEAAMNKYDLMYFMLTEMDTNGFVSREKSGNGKMSTVDRVLSNLILIEKERRWNEVPTAPEDFITNTTEFIKSEKISHPAAYYNIYELIVTNESDMVGYERSVALLIYAMVQYNRRLDLLKRIGGEFKQMSAGKYKDIEVTIESIRPFTSQYGHGSAVTMIHDGEYRLTWFTTSVINVSEKSTHRCDLTVTEEFSKEFNNTKVVRVKFHE